MTARRPSNVTSAKPRRSPRTRISSLKKPPRRLAGVAAATARITVVLPTPGRPVRRRAMVTGSLRRLGVDTLDTLGEPDDRTRREADARSYGGRAVTRR